MSFSSFSAKQTGNDYYQSLAHVTMGQNLYYEGDREKGIHSVTEAIDLMAKTDIDVTDHLIHGYLNMLASMYGAMKDYDNALKTSERTVIQIATDCGFGSSTYFSDRFRQHYGMSPTDFRTEAAKSGMIR